MVYEGEYLNGKRNGKGKIYGEKNKIIYEGELLNGIKNGIGEEYDETNKIIYKGEFINGKKHGKGKEYSYCFGEILIFEGDYFNNYRVRGKEYYCNGKLKFIGEYLFKNKWSGKLYDYDGKIIFEPNNGNVTIKEYYQKMAIYFNEKLEQNNKEEIKKGIEYDLNRRILFEGEFSWVGKWKGKVKQYLKDALTFEGEYLDGKMWNGKGKEYDDHENLIFEGEYINGEKMGM